MTVFKSITVIFSVSILFLILVSCSGSSKDRKSPIEPPISEDIPEATDELPGIVFERIHNRLLLAVYEATIDPVAKTIVLKPAIRKGQYENPLADIFQDALQIIDYAFEPNFWMDIKLTHPLPDSGIDVFDPRVIAILPADAGYSFFYPEFEIEGNNSFVLEPDGYTRIFNDIDVSIPGNVNPFIAYFKDQPHRIWSSTQNTEETKRWYMDIDDFEDPKSLLLAVDVSTNYPDPPEPIVDNTPEPYEIDASIDDGLSNLGGSAAIEVRLKHWKNIDDIGGVLIEAPSLLNDVLPIQYYSYSPHYDASVYKGSLKNERFAPEGKYNLMVKSWDVQTGIEMFNEFHANVQHLSPGGNLMWAKNAGQVFLNTLNMPTITTGITAVADDSFVMMGNFWESAIFGEGEPNETKLIGSRSFNMFIARYNLDGSFIWASAALATSTSSQAITSLPDGSTVITGLIWYRATFGPGEPNETTLESRGKRYFFIARYNPDGTLAWAKQTSGENSSWARAVTALSDNSIVIIGSFRGTAIFGKGESNETHLFSPKRAMFIARYNADGTLAWAKEYGAVRNGLAITTLSDDSMIVTGIYWNPSTGKRNIAVARCNPDGSIEWISLAGGDNSSYAYAVTVLSVDSAVVTGKFAGSIIFGKGEPNETTLISAGNDDTFIARYNPDGTLHWANRVGGSSNNRGNDITSLSDNSIVVTGSYEDTIIFGEGEPNETILSDGGVFIAGYNPDGSLKWAKRASTCYYQIPSIISLYDDTSVLVGGYWGPTIFGEGELNETTLTGSCIFMARFNQ